MASNYLNIPQLPRLLVLCLWGTMRSSFVKISCVLSLGRACRLLTEYLQAEQSKFSTTNGFVYPQKLALLPRLNEVEERMVSPPLPFMNIRRLTHSGGQYGIKGQIVNVPIDVQKTVRSLPRSVPDDAANEVHLKRSWSFDFGWYQQKNKARNEPKRARLCPRPLDGNSSGSPDESQPIQDTDITHFITGTPKPPVSKHRDGPPATIRIRQDTESLQPSAQIGALVKPLSELEYVTMQLASHSTILARIEQRMSNVATPIDEPVEPQDMPAYPVQTNDDLERLEASLENKSIFPALVDSEREETVRITGRKLVVEKRCAIVLATILAAVTREAWSRKKWEAKRLSEKLRDMFTTSLDELVQDLPEIQKVAIRTAVVQQAAKSPCGHRYTSDWIMVCLLLRLTSPKCYRTLSDMKVLPLPSASCLVQLLKGRPCEYGLNKFALEGIKFLKDFLEMMNRTE
ncbi:hypothetical protein HPB49_018261 [Dermacentor silvarum]|uniref:Uncharacterized protein n=1 Tax=Dermacentor silvarum TaxID=543639 RepID=A0ACB8CYW6_DERSI|nr:hypothetical protein HPB49_018261 [Dermacentor silvarum]